MYVHVCKSLCRSEPFLRFCLCMWPYLHAWMRIRQHVCTHVWMCAVALHSHPDIDSSGIYLCICVHLCTQTYVGTLIKSLLVVAFCIFHAWWQSIQGLWRPKGTQSILINNMNIVALQDFSRDNNVVCVCVCVKCCVFKGGMCVWVVLCTVLQGCIYSQY